MRRWNSNSPPKKIIATTTPIVIPMTPPVEDEPEPGSVGLEGVDWEVGLGGNSDAAKSGIIIVAVSMTLAHALLLSGIWTR